MPKVRSRGRASRASTGGPTRASPRASVRASSVAAQSVPASSSRISRARSSVQAPDGVAVPSQETPSIPRPQQQSQPEALLSPAFIETLITKVADEVSRRLSPAENSSSQPPTAPSNLTEVPRLSTDGLPPTTPSTLQEIPVDSTGGQSSQVPADLIATRVVQGSLATVSNAVTGLVPPHPKVHHHYQVSASNLWVYLWMPESRRNCGRKSGKTNLLTLALFL